MERTFVSTKNQALTASARKQYIRISRDLCYPNEVLVKLRSAKTVYEAERILHWARNNS